MRSRAGSWDRKEGSHLQSLDPSRVALLESRSSTTITSAIVVRRLVPLELRRFVGFRPSEGAGASSKAGCRGEIPGSNAEASTARRSIGVPRERDAASDRPTQTKSVSG